MARPGGCAPPKGTVSKSRSVCARGAQLQGAGGARPWGIGRAPGGICFPCVRGMGSPEGL